MRERIPEVHAGSQLNDKLKAYIDAYAKVVLRIDEIIKGASQAHPGEYAAQRAELNRLRSTEEAKKVAGLVDQKDQGTESYLRAKLGNTVIRTNWAEFN